MRSIEELLYASMLLLSVFIGSMSQVMLKKAAVRHYNNLARQYLNPLVIFAYVLFVGTTLLSILAYRRIPLSMGPVLEATSYIYVTFFGVKLFGEKLNAKKILALVLIIAGIVVSAIWG